MFRFLLNGILSVSGGSEIAQRIGEISAAALSAVSRFHAENESKEQHRKNCAESENNFQTIKGDLNTIVSAAAFAATSAGFEFQKNVFPEDPAGQISKMIEIFLRQIAEVLGATVQKISLNVNEERQIEIAETDLQSGSTENWRAKMAPEKVPDLQKIFFRAEFKDFTDFEKWVESREAALKYLISDDGKKVEKLLEDFQKSGKNNFQKWIAKQNISAENLEKLETFVAAFDIDPGQNDALFWQYFLMRDRNFSYFDRKLAQLVSGNSKQEIAQVYERHLQRNCATNFAEKIAEIFPEKIAQILFLKSKFSKDIFKIVGVENVGAMQLRTLSDILDAIKILETAVADENNLQSESSDEKETQNAGKEIGKKLREVDDFYNFLREISEKPKLFIEDLHQIMSRDDYGSENKLITALRDNIDRLLPETVKVEFDAMTLSESIQTILKTFLISVDQNLLEKRMRFISIESKAVSDLIGRFKKMDELQKNGKFEEFADQFIAEKQHREIAQKQVAQIESEFQKLQEKEIQMSRDFRAAKSQIQNLEKYISGKSILTKFIHDLKDEAEKNINKNTPARISTVIQRLKQNFEAELEKDFLQNATPQEIFSRQLFSAIFSKVADDLEFTFVSNVSNSDFEPLRAKIENLETAANKLLENISKIPDAEKFRDEAREAIQKNVILNSQISRGEFPIFSAIEDFIAEKIRISGGTKKVDGPRQILFFLEKYLRDFLPADSAVLSQFEKLKIGKSVPEVFKKNPNFESVKSLFDILETWPQNAEELHEKNFEMLKAALQKMVETEKPDAKIPNSFLRILKLVSVDAAPEKLIKKFATPVEQKVINSNLEIIRTALGAKRVRFVPRPTPAIFRQKEIPFRPEDFLTFGKIFDGEEIPNRRDEIIIPFKIGAEVIGFFSAEEINATADSVGSLRTSLDLISLNLQSLSPEKYPTKESEPSREYKDEKLRKLIQLTTLENFNLVAFDAIANNEQKEKIKKLLESKIFKEMISKIDWQKAGATYGTGLSCIYALQIEKLEKISETKSAKNEKVAIGKLVEKYRETIFFACLQNAMSSLRHEDFNDNSNENLNAQFKKVLKSKTEKFKNAANEKYGAGISDEFFEKNVEKAFDDRNDSAFEQWFAEKEPELKNSCGLNDAEKRREIYSLWLLGERFNGKFEKIHNEFEELKESTKIPGLNLNEFIPLFPVKNIFAHGPKYGDPNGKERVRQDLKKLIREVYTDYELQLKLNKIFPESDSEDFNEAEFNDLLLEIFEKELLPRKKIAEFLHAELFFFSDFAPHWGSKIQSFLHTIKQYSLLVSNQPTFEILASNFLKKPAPEVTVARHCQDVVIVVDSDEQFHEMIERCEHLREGLCDLFAAGIVPQIFYSENAGAAVEALDQCTRGAQLENGEKNLYRLFTKSPLILDLSAAGNFKKEATKDQRSTIRTAHVEDGMADWAAFVSMAKWAREMHALKIAAAN